MRVGVGLDEEVITVDFSRLDPHTYCLFLVLNCFSGGVCFDDVAAVFTRVLPANSDHPLYFMSSSDVDGPHTGVLLLKIYRKIHPVTKHMDWELTCIDDPAPGRTIEDLQDLMKVPSMYR